MVAERASVLPGVKAYRIQSRFKSCMRYEAEHMAPQYHDESSCFWVLPPELYLTDYVGFCFVCASETFDLPAQTFWHTQMRPCTNAEAMCTEQPFVLESATKSVEQL